MNKFLNFLFTVLILLLSFFISSCGDTKEINEKNIITTVALDKKNGEICLYTEIANVESGNKNNNGGNEGNKYKYFVGHGKTLPEARDNLDSKMNRQLYLSAVRMLVLTEEFSKEHLVEYLYRLRADEEYRKKVMIVITKEDPKKLLDTLNEKNESVGFSIDELLTSLDDQRKSFSRTTSRIIENLSSTYTGILIPCIGLNEDKIALIGYSIINGTKVDGFIPIEDSKGVIYLKADEPKFSYIVPYNDIEFTIEVELKKRKMIPNLANGVISFDVQLGFDAKLMYGNEKIPYNFGDQYIKTMTEILTRILNEEITDAIDRAQKEFKCDYLQFDDEFRMKYPEKFEEMDWASEFQKADIKNEVKVELNSTWMIDYGSYKLR